MTQRSLLIRYRHNRLARVVCIMQDRFSLQGKVVLLTGASSGIGAHAAKMFAQAGARVVVTARRLQRLNQVVSDIEAQGGEALAVAMDVQDGQSVDAAFDQVAATLGTVDVLLNNAGYGGDTTLMVDTSEENWDAVMGTNLKGAWRVAKEAANRLLAAEKSGSIINITSIAAHGQSSGFSTYSSSKAALLSLTKTMALEMATHNIRVNALSPGTFPTEMTAGEFTEDGDNEHLKVIPMGRIGELEDLDGALLLLASEASAYITGVCIPVDGGHLVNSL